MFAGLQSGIEVTTHTVGQSRREREVQSIRGGYLGYSGDDTEAEEEEEAELRVEIDSTEEEATQRFEAALGMEVDEEGQGE